MWLQVRVQVGEWPLPQMERIGVGSVQKKVAVTLTVVAKREGHGPLSHSLGPVCPS